jgi:hypothetical protein
LWCRSRIKYKSDDNIAILSGTEIKIYLNREGYIVLPKGTKGLIEIDKYLDFDILNKILRLISEIKKTADTY